MQDALGSGGRRGTPLRPEPPLDAERRSRTMKIGRRIWYKLLWLPAASRQRIVRRGARAQRVQLVLALSGRCDRLQMPAAAATYTHTVEPQRCLKCRCQEHPKRVDRWRDGDGRPFGPPIPLSTMSAP